MNKKKILVVFGTRPEAIKLAPLIIALKAKPEQFEVLINITSQHREMLDQVLSVFSVTPDIDLNLMTPNQNLFDITSSILKNMKNVIEKFKPHIVLVHGDTTTTFAAALASFYSSIPVGHVEAGLRTYDLKKPFPEEFNRQVTTKVSSLHFAPTSLSKKNLISEGIQNKTIFVVGNTVIDAMYWVLNRIKKDKNKKKLIESRISNSLSFDWKSERFVLVTAHRRENFGNGIIQICEAIHKLAALYKTIHFIYPVHLNPNIKNIANNILSNLKNVHLIEPLEYECFIYLLNHSYIVLTDSGGIQEEAPSLGIPVLVMREVTERPEAVEAGTVKLVGAKKETIVTYVSRLLECKNEYLEMTRKHNPYGDGRACQRILEVLRKI